jgi:hypothetical protein
MTKFISEAPITGPEAREKHTRVFCDAGKTPLLWMEEGLLWNEGLMTCFRIIFTDCYRGGVS